MQFSNIKKDWWLANSVLLFISAGIIIFIGIFTSSNIVGSLIAGGIDALIGVALLQRSKIAFWLTLTTRIYNFLKFLAIAKTDASQLYSVNFLLIIVMLAFVLMLWQQIRTESKGSKT